MSEVPGDLCAQDVLLVRATHDVLAWVLGQPCGESFARNLALAEALLKRMGYKLVDAGEVISHEEARRRGLVP